MSIHKLKAKAIIFSILLSIPFLGLSQQQSVTDNFEGNGTIDSWYGDDCGLDTTKANPFSMGINTSSRVLEYNDVGGNFANVRFEVPNNFDLSSKYTFSFKVYVPGSGISGNQTNQVSVKLQDGLDSQPWTTQCEIIKPLVLDQWQVLSFDFKNDPFINANSSSLPPTQRNDFNRVVIQINGENNTDLVLAYIDDVAYDGTVRARPVFGKMIWSDEFNVSGAVDGTKWFHQTQLPNGGSWFNGEVQHYTNRIANSNVITGILKIVAKKETFNDQGHTKNYTSARLNSKFAFKYGKVELRAKMPEGRGTWPAIWMLGKNISEAGAYWQTQGFGSVPWPACGEIDIMEHWGSNQDFVQSAIHTPSSSGNTVNKGGRILSTTSTAFHDYSLEWTPDELVFRIDGQRHYTYNPSIKNSSTWPFDAEQYLILNIAIESNIDPAFTEDAMEIDYIRVYEFTGVSTKGSPETKGLNFYPNPVEDHIRIQLGQYTEDTTELKLYSSNGSLLRSINYNVYGGEILVDNFGDLASGIYLLSFQLDGQPYSIKFSKI